MSENPFSTSALGGAGFGAFAPRGADAPSPDEPAWKTAFEATLEEIDTKGFRAYAEDLNERKIEEMRKKILEEMGLTEEEFEKLPAEARMAIEKTIRERLTAEAALDNEGQVKPQRPDAAALADPDAAGAQAGQSGMNAGMTLIRAMEARSAEREPEAGQ